MKKQIESFAKTHLRILEWFWFHHDSNNVFVAHNLPTDVFPNLWSIHLALFNSADVIIKPLMKSQYTEAIKEADQARDKAVKNLVKAIELFMDDNADNAAIVEAGKRALRLIKGYGNIPSLPYTQETGAIYNLTQDFKILYPDDVTLLNLTERLQVIEDKNNAFDALMDIRYDEKANKPNEKVKDIRRELDESFDKLIISVESYLLNTPAHGLEEFVNKMNAIITRNKQTLAIREGVAKAKKEKEEKEAKNDQPEPNDQPNTGI